MGTIVMSLSALVLLTSTFVVGQRPFFAGSRPIGFPDTPNRTTTTPDPLGNRFGEGTTERLPIEANGDRDLIDRLSKLPIDKQPFWFINWKALEAHRKNPQTYPQRPNVFANPIVPTPNNENRFQTIPTGNSNNLNSNFITTTTTNKNVVPPAPTLPTLNSNIANLNSNNVGLNSNNANLNSNNANLNMNNANLNTNNANLNTNNANLNTNNPNLNTNNANLNTNNANLNTNNANLNSNSELGNRNGVAVTAAAAATENVNYDKTPRYYFVQKRSAQVINHHDFF